MAPCLEDAGPSGEAMGAKCGEAASATRLVNSASAPGLGAHKGVCIMIDPTAPMREGVLDETDFLSLPQSTASQACQRHGKSAWTCSSPNSPSRPGSRSGTKFSSRQSTMSSEQRSLSGRFSYDELLCFKRVPTPSSSCEHKRDNYWQTGGSGELRKMLSNDNWHSLPVLKGKFYQHPKLSDSVAHCLSEKARAEKEKQERQIKLERQKVHNLPDEKLTATLLDRIFPKTPTTEFRELGMDSPEPTTPPGESTRKFPRTRSIVAKRLSAAELRITDTPKADTIPEPPFTTTHASSTANLLSASPTTQLGSSTGIGSPGGTGSPMGREGHQEKQRREILLDFRKQIFDRFQTIKDGFDVFAQAFPQNREMTKKEWRRVVSKLGFEATVEERDAIFELLDFNNNHHVSILEFHIALEAAVPIRSMEDLRRRWLASSIPSMNHALSIMDDGGVFSNKRLTFREFAELLCRVYVVDPAEHLALFNLIADPTERQAKVTIGELASAIATVSPATYLEEVRHRLLKRYGGSAQKCFWDIDQDHSNSVSFSEFRSRAVFRMGLTEMEAEKMFTTIDFDHNGSISSSEFLCALSMSEPNLFHEDLRKTIRQRFRSIRDAFTDAMEEAQNADLHQNPKLNFGRFSNLLSGLDMKEEELRSLFDLIDANGDGTLTIKEFIQGVRYFAPSCVLEDLRLLCLQQSDRVEDIFAHIGVDRMAPLDVEAFQGMLETRNLTADVDVYNVFLLLDVRNEGVVTMGKLVAALQSGGPGSRIKLEPEERDQKAIVDVKNCIQPTQKIIGDLKSQVRVGHRLPEDNSRLLRQTYNEGSKSDTMDSVATDGNGAHSTFGSRPHTSDSPAGHRYQHSKSDAQGRGNSPHGRRRASGLVIAMRAQKSETPQAWGTAQRDGRKANTSPVGSAKGRGGNQERAMSPSGGGASSGKEDEDEVSIQHSNVAPRLRALPQEELAKYMAKLDPSRITEHKKIAEDPVVGAQHSWGRVWRALHQMPDPKERAPLQRELLTYFQTTASKMSQDVPLLERSHSRHAILRSVKAHTKALAQTKMPKS